MLCVGEMLVDFVCLEKGSSLKQGQTFAKMPGGAPANVAACIGKLGGQSEFAGAIGRDSFGDFLLDTLSVYRVETQYIQRVSTPTTLAFVSRMEDGERDFEFVRGADELFSTKESDLSLYLINAILHLGSATALLGGTLYESYMQLASAAKSQGNIVSFDPNYREDLWKGKEEEFKRRCLPLFALAEIVKVSEEELTLLTGQESLQKGCHYLHHLGSDVVLVTMGAQGCLLSYEGRQIQIPAYDIEAVDTTGAGDAFIGAVLYKISTMSDHKKYKSELVDIVRFAEKVSARVCTQIGAMSALPELHELNDVYMSTVMN